MSNIMLERALYLARRGLHVFPLKPRAKTPLVKWTTTATTNEQAIADWWSQWPDANIGIATGLSGLLVVDVDAKKNGLENFAELEAEYGALVAPKVHTGGGGVHLYFQRPEGGLGNSAGKVAGGIDTRCDGGYVVAPGSIHENGRPYEWADEATLDDTPIDQAPEWLLQRLTQPKADLNETNAPVIEQDVLWVKADEAFTPPKLELVMAGCAFVRHCRDDAAFLSEEDWYAAGSIVGRCDDGERQFHEMSRPHPKYRAAETSAKLAHALQASGPRTCEDIANRGGGSYCGTCPNRGKIKSPIVLGRDANADAAERAKAQYGISPDPRRYVLNADGVFPVRLTKSGEYKADFSRPIAMRPIFPSAHGLNVANRSPYVRLSWANSQGHLCHQWLPDASTNDRTVLLGLSGAPISLGRVNVLSDWLTDAKAWVAEAPLNIAASLGWVGEGSDQRFILGSTPGLEFIGKTLGAAGTVSAWAEPVRKLAIIGQSGYTALVVLGLSAASPLARLLGKRNPVIGLTASSSQGKGSAIGLALAIWGNPSAFTVPSGSTPKGVQDRALGVNDFPIFVDEIQQMVKAGPQRAEDSLYFIGNGQRRVTSSKAQEAVGGEKRFGAGLYAAEDPIATGLNLGAIFRVIELSGPPMPSAELADEVQAATRSNYGVVGPLLAAKVNDMRETAHRFIEASAKAIAERWKGLRGEDAYTIALVASGLQMLAEVTGFELPVSDVTEWLTKTVCANRGATVDKYTAAWQAIIETAQGLVTGTSTDPYNGHKDVLIANGHIVAWVDPTRRTCPGGLDLNPRAPIIEQIVRANGGEVACSKVWAERGWLERDGKDLKARRSHGGQRLRVWRVSAEGAKAAGFELDDCYSANSPESRQVLARMPIAL